MSTGFLTSKISDFEKKRTATPTSFVSVMPLLPQTKKLEEKMSKKILCFIKMELKQSTDVKDVKDEETRGDTGRYRLLFFPHAFVFWRANHSLPVAPISPHLKISLMH